MMAKRKEVDIKVETIKKAEAKVEAQIKLPVELSWKKNGWMKN